MLGNRTSPIKIEDNDTDHADITKLHTYPITNNYLKKLFTWVGVWALLALAFIWIVDPYGVSPINIKIHRFNAYKPKRLDIDRLIKPFEVWRYQPKTIFIGTSRIHQSIDPATLDGTEFAPAYNAAIPASTLAENADNIEQFIKLDPNIEHIFIELFLYNFTGQSQTSHPKTWQQFFSNLASLHISSDALFDSIQTVRRNRKKHAPTPSEIAKGGYRVYGSDFNPADTFSEPLFMKTVLSWDRAAKMELKEDAFKSLDRIVNIAHQHHIKLHFILTPNYPWDDHRLVTLGYWPMLEKWMKKISSYSNVVSFSQYNSVTTEKPIHQPKMKWWNDPIHFNLSVGQMMMGAYLEHPIKGTPTNFMRHVTPNTVRSVIAERRAGAQQWASMHPDFVADFEEAKSIKDTVNGTLYLDKKLLIVNGINHSIESGLGEISIVKNEGNKLIASGWAVDEIAKRHPSLLVATLGDTVVSQGYATTERADIGKKINKTSVVSGFNIDIPMEHWDKSKSVRVFALMKNGRAVQLSAHDKHIASA